MNPERARLKRQSRLVNATCVAGVIFALAGCGQPEPAPAPPQRPGAISLPAVWNSGPLPRTPASIALSEGARGVVAMAYKGHGVQVYDYEGAPLGAEADLKLEQVGRGQTAFFGEARLVLFPTLDEAGTVGLIASADGLVAPIAIDLEVGNTTPVKGICGGSAGPEPGSLMRIGYWAAAAPETLSWGDVLADADGNLSWKPAGSLSTGARVTACSFDASGPVIASGPLVLRAADFALGPEQLADRVRMNAPVLALDVVLREDGQERWMARLETGQIVSLRTGGGADAVSITPGLSVEAPSQAATMAAIALPRSGGYPFGVMALTGTDGSGQPRLTLVDLGTLWSGQ